MALREHNGIACALRQARGAGRRARRRAWRGLAAALLALALPALAAAEDAARDVTGQDSETPPLLPEAPAAAPAGPEVARLKEAFEQMSVENPVVARVNGHPIRWAEVVASAGDLPPRYRD